MGGVGGHAAGRCSCCDSVLRLGGAASSIQEMCLAEAAVQAEEASGGGLLPDGPPL